MQVVIRGTTPSIVLSGLDQDLTTWDVYATFEWDVSINHERYTGQITKSGNDLTVTSTSVSVQLSQEDTLAFPEKPANCGTLPKVRVQLKAYKSGDVIATNADDETACFYVGTSLLDTPLGD